MVLNVSIPIPLSCVKINSSVSDDVYPFPTVHLALASMTALISGMFL